MGLAAAKELADGDDLESAAAAYETLLAGLEEDPVGASAVLHMYALIVDEPRTKLELNLESISRAVAAGPSSMPVALRATLMANTGYSCLQLGDTHSARTWYLLAQEAAVDLDEDDYGRMVRRNISALLAGLAPTQG